MGGFFDLLLILGIAFGLCGMFYNGCILYIRAKQWFVDKFRV